MNPTRENHGRSWQRISSIGINVSVARLFPSKKRSTIKLRFPVIHLILKFIRLAQPYFMVKLEETIFLSMDWIWMEEILKVVKYIWTKKTLLPNQFNTFRTIAKTAQHWLQLLKHYGKKIVLKLIQVKTKYQKWQPEQQSFMVNKSDLENNKELKIESYKIKYKLKKINKIWKNYFLFIKFIFSIL